MDAFYHFTKKIVESNNEQCKEQYEERQDEREESTNNAMGMAEVKLMNGNTIQTDNIMRARLQKRIGSFETTSANGESVETIWGKRANQDVILSNQKECTYQPRKGWEEGNIDPILR